jgi:hypothetical protein
MMFGLPERPSKTIQAPRIEDKEWLLAFGNDGTALDSLLRSFVPPLPMIAAHGNDGAQDGSLWKSNFSAWANGQFAPAPPFVPPHDNEAVAVETEIEKAIGIFAAHGEPVELCGFKSGKPYWVGYFDKIGDFVKNAECIDQDMSGTYMTVNPVKPGTMKRAENKLVRCTSRTVDEEISRRVWLYVDFDAARPEEHKKNPASEAEHQAALDAALACRDWLREQGFPDPLRTDSGNGAALFYKIDLANDKESSALVTSSLKAIAAKFNSDKVKVDTSVANAARLCRMPGTMNRRGKESVDRPYRMAQILEAPDKLEVVPREKLEALTPKPKPVVAKRSKAKDFVFTEEITAAEFAAKYNLAIVSTKDRDYATVHNLAACPFSKDHTDGAYLIQFPSGYLDAGCHHDRCREKGFKDLARSSGTGNLTSKIRTRPRWPGSASGSAGDTPTGRRSPIAGRHGSSG